VNTKALCWKEDFCTRRKEKGERGEEEKGRRERSGKELQTKEDEKEKKIK